MFIWTCFWKLLTASQLQVRGLANGAAAAANWVTNAVVSQLFLALADYIGGSGVFWLLACIAFGGGFWVHFCLPETRGALLWSNAFHSVALILSLSLLSTEGKLSKISQVRLGLLT